MEKCDQVRVRANKQKYSFGKQGSMVRIRFKLNLRHNWIASQDNIRMSVTQAYCQDNKYVLNICNCNCLQLPIPVLQEMSYICTGVQRVRPAPLQTNRDTYCTYMWWLLVNVIGKVTSIQVLLKQATSLVIVSGNKEGTTH